MFNKFIICTFPLFLIAFNGANAYVTSGHLKTKNELTLLGRFCFSKVSSAKTSDIGGINIVETASEYSHGTTFFAMYYDEKFSWGAVEKNKTSTCEEKRKLASMAMTVTSTKEATYHPHDYVRPHIWYVAALNCPLSNETKPSKLDTKYTITFKNVDNSHFGFDEMGMLPLNAVYFVFFIILTGVQIVACYFLWMRRSLHPIVQILAICLILITFSVMFVLIHWANYKQNGRGCPGCRVFGQLLSGFSSIFFALLLIMIASGWAVTYHILPRKIIVLGIFAAYVLFYLILFICANATGSNAASTQLVYTSGTLLGFVIVYILLCWFGIYAYFAYSLYLTFRDETQFEKKLFYLIFGIGYSFWYVLPSFLNLISIAVAEWYRPRLVDAFQLTVSFIGMAAMVVLLWPTRVEKFFRIISSEVLSDTETI